MEEFFIVAGRRSEGVPWLYKACEDKIFFDLKDAEIYADELGYPNLAIYRCEGEVKERVVVEGEESRKDALLRLGDKILKDNGGDLGKLPLFLCNHDYQPEPPEETED